VLRRIIRRALRHGHELGVTQPFFHLLVEPLAKEMGAAYPELREGRLHVERVLCTEEERFAETLAQGMRLLRDALTQTHGKPLAGEVIFKLYDTYGFPADLTADVARAQGIATDMPGFEAAMDAQRERARAAQKFNVAQDAGTRVEGHTQFTGYDHLSDNGQVVALLKDGKQVDYLGTGQSGVVVLDRTPFYAESGGQVGDRGELRLVGVRFIVDDTRKSGDAVLHVGRMETGSISIGDQLSAQVDGARVAVSSITPPRICCTLHPQGARHVRKAR
jgi:alanyl-tRNA synthetase